MEHQGRKEAPYRLWAQQGWLTLCDGATVDYNDVTEWFVSMVQERDIRPLWVCYDAALSGYWVPQMTDMGFEMERIRQGPVTWTYPMKRMKGLFEDHRIVYQNNPICAGVCPTRRPSPAISGASTPSSRRRSPPTGGLTARCPCSTP